MNPEPSVQQIYIECPVAVLHFESAEERVWFSTFLVVAVVIGPFIV